MYLNWFVLILIRYTHTETIQCNAKDTGHCGCSTHISGETCTLDCASENKCQDGILTCRSDDSCLIDCSAYSACNGNTIINANFAIDTTIICGGENSCKGNTLINCGIGNCQLTCEEYTSCQSLTVDISAANSFNCKPTNNCRQISIITAHPTKSPFTPTEYPTIDPTGFPTPEPTQRPSISPYSNYTIGPTQFPTPEPTERPSLAPIYMESTDSISDSDDTQIITEYQDVIIGVSVGVGSLLMLIIGLWCIYRYCRVNKYETNHTMDKENETDDETVETTIHDTDEELVQDTV
eukprot:98429_1